MQANPIRKLSKSKDPQRIAKIVEILGILSNRQKGRDWLEKEVKRQHLKISLKDSLNSFEILKTCPDNFISTLYRNLKDEKGEGFEKTQSLTKTYHWLFTDIVGGSNPTTPTKTQVRKIMILNELMARTETFRKRDASSTVILPVGDGVAVGFSDYPEKPLHLAIELHKALYRYNQSRDEKDKLYIRIGIDMGPVYFVKDLNGKDNVWGPGIILTRRVMDLCSEMNIFASARIAENIRKLSPEYTRILHPIGNYSIKHGEELSIYNIYGSGFGNKKAPRKAKVVASNLQRDIKPENNFAFEYVGIGLDVLDQTTMLVRHTWKWTVLNISKAPMEHIFYFLDGDTPKEFGDLNVKVRDDNDEVLEILSVNENKPYHKAFNVQFKKPIKPKKKQTFVLQYDWEEPLRTYFYKFASGCRHFVYSLTSPNSVDLKPKIFKVDSETGSKTDAIPSPTVTTSDGRILVAWEKENLGIEAYQFDW